MIKSKLVEYKTPTPSPRTASDYLYRLCWLVSFTTQNQLLCWCSATRVTDQMSAFIHSFSIQIKIINNIVGCLFVCVLLLFFRNNGYFRYEHGYKCMLIAHSLQACMHRELDSQRFGSITKNTKRQQTSIQKIQYKQKHEQACPVENFPTGFQWKVPLTKLRHYVLKYTMFPLKFQIHKTPQFWS